MPGLGETVARLARAGQEASAALGLGAAERRFTETVAFGSNPGGLRMLSYAPEGLPRGAPLVVVLHGCAQAAEGHAVAGGWDELADRLGFAVLAPEQTTANNLNRCFNWFSPGDIARGKGEAASIAEMIDAAIHAHGLDPQRVYVTGLSAGGAMAAVMLAAYPERFAGGAIVAGLPYGAAGSLHDAMQVMKGRDARTPAELGALVRDAAPASARRPLRLSIWHGDADTVADPSNAHDLVAQWTDAAGLAEARPVTVELPGRTRTAWADPARGVMVELNMVHGFGHGTPLATEGEDGLGAPAPFMLEAGMSSTLEIARFWGLQRSSGYAYRPAADAHAAPSEPAGVAAHVLEVLERRTPDEVRQVIAKALRSAGLGR